MQFNKSKNGYLAKNSILFAISNISTKLISFIMVPLYTAYLTTSEYGSIDIITTTISLIMPLITLSISNAILRYALEKNELKESILTISVIIVSLGSFLLILFYPLITMIEVFKDNSILLILITISYGYYTIFSEFTRGIENIIKFVIGNILNIFTNATLNIIFMIYLHLGIKGYLYSILISYILSTIYYLILCNEYRYIIFNKKFLKSDLTKKMINYSIYLIPNSLFWWVTNVSDRYIILIFLNTGQNGIYAIANRIPIILTSIFSIFIQAWQMSAIRNYKTVNNKEYSQIIYNKLLSLLLICVSGIFCFLKLFLSYYVNSNFFIAWKCCLYLILAGAFSLIATFLGINYIVAKQNKGNMFSTLFGTIINIILNLIFVPILGIVGAAIATMISYICVVIYRIFDTKKYLNIQYISINSIVSLALIIIQMSILLKTDALIIIKVLIISAIICIINRSIIIDSLIIIRKLLSRAYIKFLI